MVGRAIPSVRRVTSGAVRSKFARVFVVLLMTSETVLRNALIFVVDVTQIASHFDMLARQFELREVMVKLRGFLPTIGGVTDGAFIAKLPLMRVVFGVTVNTFLFGRLQVGDVARAVVTF